MDHSKTAQCTSISFHDRCILLFTLWLEVETQHKGGLPRD